MDAKREALRRLKDNNGLNALGGQCEWAYSPATGAVGMREAHTDAPYRIVNVNYPMYGRAHLVTDWVSVGIEKPKRGWHWRLVSGVWTQSRNVPGRTYHVVDGQLIERGVSCHAQ